jgi:hypothetical protein
MLSDPEIVWTRKSVPPSEDPFLGGLVQSLFSVLSVGIGYWYYQWTGAFLVACGVVVVLFLTYKIVH